MRTLLAFLLLSSLAIAADRSAELEKALARNRTLLVIGAADLVAANKAAVVAFGPAGEKMFSVAFSNDGAKQTHYVACLRMTPLEKARFDKAFDALTKTGRFGSYLGISTTAKLAELKLLPISTAVEIKPAER
jgi:hypothetical protein